MNQDPLHEVNNLSEISPNHKYSGFGIILDTTRGTKVKGHTSEYSTQIKLIDMSLNPASQASTSLAKQYITVFLFWSHEENQPFPYKIGDIMRFHLFDFEKFSNSLQAKNRKGSSWCIFHGDNSSSEPYCQSSDFKEKISLFHTQHLVDLRQWSTSFFQTHSLQDLDWYSYERHVENPAILQSFDMLLRVNEIYLQPDHPNDLLLMLVDEKQQPFSTHVSMIHRKFLKRGDIVKVRSIESIIESYLKGHSRYFAVLGVPSFFRNYQEFLNNYELNRGQGDMAGLIEEEAKDEQAGNKEGVFDVEFFEKGGSILEGGVILSSGISLRRKDMSKPTGLEILKDLESQSLDKHIREGQKYHLRATLIDVRPKALAQSLRRECRNCGQLRKFDALEGEICCSMKMRLTMVLRLLWQDQSLKQSKKLLISYVTPGGENYGRWIFPEFPLEDITKDNLEEKEKLFDALVERYLEDDRVFDVLLEPFDNAWLYEKEKQIPLRITETLFVPVLKKEPVGVEGLGL